MLATKSVEMGLASDIVWLGYKEGRRSTLWLPADLSGDRKEQVVEALTAPGYGERIGYGHEAHVFKVGDIAIKRFRGLTCEGWMDDLTASVDISAVLSNSTNVEGTNWNLVGANYLGALFRHNGEHRWAMDHIRGKTLRVAQASLSKDKLESLPDLQVLSKTIRAALECKGLNPATFNIDSDNASNYLVPDNSFEAISQAADGKPLDIVRIDVGVSRAHPNY